MASSEVDISKLALSREPRKKESRGSARPRSLFARYILPATILLGLAGLLLFSASDYFAKRITVKAIPVIVTKGEIQTEGTPLFKAPGWVEPRPTATSVSSLNPGVLQELLVVEGQEVKKGTLIARLNSEDARLALDNAKTVVTQATASVQQVKAERDAAKTRRDLPVHLEVMIAEAETRQTEVQTQLKQLPFLLESAEAKRRYAKASYEGKKAAGAAIPGVVLEQSKSDYESADADVRELVGRKSSLGKQLQAIETKMKGLQFQRKLLVEENRQLKEAEAKVQMAQAVLLQKKIMLQKAQLDFDRTKIYSPVAGRVLRLVAFPGDRVVGVTSGDGNSVIVELYNPKKLQVRADVRLEDIPKVSNGQPVEIETASSNQKILGKVLQVNSKANIQKNTLQVKVEILDPPLVIRPEMLVTATFLSPKSKADPGKSKQTNAIVMISKDHLHKENEKSFVWVVEAGNIAVKRWVKTSSLQSDGNYVIKEGIKTTDKIITDWSEPLSENCLVAVDYQ